MRFFGNQMQEAIDADNRSIYHASGVSNLLLFVHDTFDKAEIQEVCMVHGTKGKPAKIFLLIGINDLSGGRSIEEIAKNIDEIAERIKKESPSTRLYLQSVLPLNPKFNMFVDHMKRKKDVPALNALIKDIANRRSLTYIDLFSEFVAPGTQDMNPDYSNDGLHLLGKGYQNWVRILKPYLGK